MADSGKFASGEAIRVDIAGIRPAQSLAEKLRRAGKEAGQVSQALHEVGENIVREAKRLVPVGYRHAGRAERRAGSPRRASLRSPSTGRFQADRLKPGELRRGSLRNSIRSAKANGRVTVYAGANDGTKAYAATQEYGRKYKPGKKGSGVKGTHFLREAQRMTLQQNVRLIGREMDRIEKKNFG